jgi:hypothetical protein
MAAVRTIKPQHVAMAMRAAKRRNHHRVNVIPVAKADLAVVHPTMCQQKDRTVTVALTKHVRYEIDEIIEHKSTISLIVNNLKRSEFGCCDDLVTVAYDKDKRTCPRTCDESDYRCCPDEKTAARGPGYAGCPNVEFKMYDNDIQNFYMNSPDEPDVTEHEVESSGNHFESNVDDPEIVRVQQDDASENQNDIQPEKSQILIQSQTVKSPKLFQLQEVIEDDADSVVEVQQDAFEEAIKQNDNSSKSESQKPKIVKLHENAKNGAEEEKQDEPLADNLFGSVEQSKTFDEEEDNDEKFQPEVNDQTDDQNESLLESNKKPTIVKLQETVEENPSDAGGADAQQEATGEQTENQEQPSEPNSEQPGENPEQLTEQPQSSTQTVETTTPEPAECQNTMFECCPDGVSKSLVCIFICAMPHALCIFEETGVQNEVNQHHWFQHSSDCCRSEPKQ